MYLETWMMDLLEENRATSLNQITRNSFLKIIVMSFLSIQQNSQIKVIPKILPKLQCVNWVL